MVERAASAGTGSCLSSWFGGPQNRRAPHPFQQLVTAGAAVIECTMSGCSIGLKILVRQDVTVMDLMDRTTVVE